MAPNYLNMEMLSKCPLFNGVTSSELDVLMKDLPFQIKKYAKGQMLAQSGEECRSLMIMLKGSVRGEMMDVSGKAIKIEDIEPPKPLAVAFIFGQNNRFPVNIIANDDSEVFLLPKESMLILLQRSAPFLKNFMNIISSRAQFLSDKIRFLNFQTIKGKLAHYLLQLESSQQGEIILTKSQEELATLFGVTRPSLGRALRDLHNDGLIEAKAKSILIIDRQGLMALLRKD